MPTREQHRGQLERIEELEINKELDRRLVNYLSEQIKSERRRASQAIATIWVLSGLGTVAWIAFLLIIRSS